MFDMERGKAWREAEPGVPQPLNPTIFILEDDPDIAGLLKHHLQAAGYGISWFPMSGGFLDEMYARRPALVILDIMVPGSNGLDLAKAIRNNSALAGIPIIFVTARAAEPDRLRGFEIGADDYITKPFSPKEVVARVKAVLRRFEQPLKKEIVRAGDLIIDTAAMRLTVRDEPVVTTATEFRLIEFLASHPGRVFTRKSLLDAVWHDTAFVTPRIVDVYIRRLREKIERDPEKPRHIHTARGAGYMFEVRK
ncbi:MAG TPA: response regulator transcription factor [Terriglobales bacterium]|nr:response regulator transcription factor [Terriglobales bacterium]